jgi:hypothetical protein
MYTRIREAMELPPLGVMRQPEVAPAKPRFQPDSASKNGLTW